MDNDINSILRSCIISGGGEIAIQDLEDDYKTLVGKEIPYKQYGCTSVAEFLLTIPGVELRTNEMDWDDIIVYASSAKTAHIAQMVNRQKRRRRKTRGKDDNEKQYKSRSSSRVNTSSRCYTTRLVSNSKARSTQYFNWFSSDELRQKKATRVQYCNTFKRGSSGIHDHQLVGDDFLLHLANKNLGYYVDRSMGIHNSGMCVSGQTISRAYQNMVARDIWPENVFVMLGSVDILLGRTADEMINDMRDFLFLMDFRNVNVTLSTLLPLANISHRPDLVAALNSYNTWIRSLTPSIPDLYCKYIDVVDLWGLFMTEDYHINFGYFEADSRYVTGTTQSHVLWNSLGLGLVEQSICKVLIRKKNYTFTTCRFNGLLSGNTTVRILIALLQFNSLLQELASLSNFRAKQRRQLL